MNLISLRYFNKMALVAIVCSSTYSLSQSPLPGEKVLVSNQRTSVTFAEFDAEMARIPAADHYEFLLDRKRIAQLVENVLINKTLAIEARERKLDQQPKAQAEIRIQTDKVLAKFRGIQVQTEAPKVDFLAMAREIYLTSPEKTTLPEKYEVWHVLVSTHGRTIDQAKTRAGDIRKRVVSGESLGSLAQTLSDDPAAQNNQGNLGVRELSKFDARFAAMIKTLKVGEVSPIFETDYGLHVAKLLAHVPMRRFSFAEAKADLMADAEDQYLRAVWAEYIRNIKNDPKLFVDTEALDAIRPKLPDVPKLLPPNPPAGAGVKDSTRP